MAIEITVHERVWTLTFAEAVKKVEELAHAGVIFITVKDIGESEESRLNRLLLDARDERDRALKEVKALKRPAKPKSKKK